MFLKLNLNTQCVHQALSSEISVIFRWILCGIWYLCFALIVLRIKLMKKRRKKSFVGSCHLINKWNWSPSRCTEKVILALTCCFGSHCRSSFVHWETEDHLWYVCEPVLLGGLCLGTSLLYAFFAFTKWPLENIPLNHIYLSKESKNHLTIHMIQFSYTIYTNLAKKNMTGLINMLKMQYSKQLEPTRTLTTCLPERIVMLLKGYICHVLP